MSMGMGGTGGVGPAGAASKSKGARDALSKGPGAGGGGFRDALSAAKQGYTNPISEDRVLNGFMKAIGIAAPPVGIAMGAVGALRGLGVPSEPANTGIGHQNSMRDSRSPRMSGGAGSAMTQTQQRLLEGNPQLLEMARFSSPGAFQAVSANQARAQALGTPAAPVGPKPWWRTPFPAPVR